MDDSAGKNAMKPYVLVLAALLFVNVALAILYLAMSLDPYLGNMQDFYFPCEACGWHYESKATYFCAAAIPSAALFLGAWVGWKKREHRRQALLVLSLTPVAVYLFEYFLIIKPFWLE